MVWFIPLFLLFYIFTINVEQLNTCVWLSGAAYCGKENYATMRVSGPAANFTYKETLYDNITDLQGYIGTMDSTESIYIVLRGSSSVMNWLDDFEILRVSYDTYPECNCTVHYGFYESALGVTFNTLSSIQSLRTAYPGYSIVVTGHSYGAAVGLLLALELKKSGFVNIKVYNYGQPRVGDDAFARFVNTVFAKEDYVRVTHDRDVVPHLPPTEGFGYYHACGEVFEYGDGSLRICSDTVCEDASCSAQYNLSETNTVDHSIYLAHNLSCQESIGKESIGKESIESS